MIDTKMKRTMKWHTDGYIDTDVVWEVAAKKSLENMDRDPLRRLLNSHYGLLPTQADYMKTFLWYRMMGTNNADLYRLSTMLVSNDIWDELQRRNKEEKKMEDKKYYSGSVKVTTWRSRRTFNALDDIDSNHKTDLITFRKGVFAGMTIDSNRKISEKLPLDARKKYTKKDISELITTAWDKGKYAEDQTDISWIFNPDLEEFTGTVNLATVLLKYPNGNEGHVDTQVRARCRVRIVNGTFFEKLDGSSKLADILKNHKGVFKTKEAIEMYIKNKWCVGDFGNDASYFRLEIEEES